MLTPIRGFTNTPVTKSLCILTTVFTLAIANLGQQYRLRLAIDPFIAEYHQWWRLVTYQTAVTSESDYLLVVVLWYHYKNLERFFGSRKYLSVVLLLVVANAVSVLVVMCLGQLLVYAYKYILGMVLFRRAEISYEPTIYNEVASGPLAVLSSLYVCFLWVVPTSYQFEVVLQNPYAGMDRFFSRLPSTNVLLSDRFPLHLVYILLVLNNGFRSVIPCAVGALIGKLYMDELLPGRSWLISEPLFRVFIGKRRHRTERE